MLIHINRWERIEASKQKLQEQNRNINLYMYLYKDREEHLPWRERVRVDAESSLVSRLKREFLVRREWERVFRILTIEIIYKVFKNLEAER